MSNNYVTHTCPRTRVGGSYVLFIYVLLASRLYVVTWKGVHIIYGIHVLHTGRVL